MSKGSAGGRGRGWLNLNKNQTTANNLPEIQIGNNSNVIHAPVIEDNLFVDAPEQEQEYIDLINIVKELNINDDGIKFNQKIKYLLEKWDIDCITGEDVEKSFDLLYQAGLNDDELASKLVIMISSRSFITQKVHGINIRTMFLKKVQSTFEGSKPLQKNNPKVFRNSVRILSEFFNKARLAHGAPFTFLASPVVSYLEMLLESAQPQDLQLFTQQLFLNGSSLKAEIPEKITELLNKIRDVLITNEKLTKGSKLWLLFSLDLANNRFCLLPAELHKFYQDHVDDAAIMVNFQATPATTLSVQTSQENKTLDSYQSKVNVLQVTSPSGDSSIEQYPSSDTNNHLQSFTNSSGFVSDTSSQNSSFREASHNNSGKHGRPILGAGARLKKNTSKEEDNSNWRSGKAKSERGDGRKGTKTSKGWEHDDRFENDYS